jgi:hypothetical protein
VGTILVSDAALIGSTRSTESFGVIRRKAAVTSPLDLQSAMEEITRTRLRFDDKTSERLIAVYITPDVVAQREQVVEALHLQPGERALDVRSGPGFLASTMQTGLEHLGKCAASISASRC